MRTITQAQVEQLIQDAAASERGRVVFRLHEHHEVVQRMVNAITPGSYVTPHKHQNPDKVELITVLHGKIAAFKFTEDGEIVDTFILDAGGPTHAVDILPGEWHTFVALEPSAMLEIIQGPYHPDTHKTFATFAPMEGDPTAADYLKKLEDIAQAIQ